jgi:hypothetical protein
MFRNRFPEHFLNHVDRLPRHHPGRQMHDVHVFLAELLERLSEANNIQDVRRIASELRSELVGDEEL